jgi:hypothetical protein
MSYVKEAMDRGSAMSVQTAEQRAETIAAVTNSGHSIYFASPEVRGDKAVVLAAVAQVINLFFQCIYHHAFEIAGCICLGICIRRAQG